MGDKLRNRVEEQELDEAYAEEVLRATEERIAQALTSSIRLQYKGLQERLEKVLKDKNQRNKEGYSPEEILAYCEDLFESSQDLDKRVGRLNNKIESLIIEELYKDIFKRDYRQRRFEI